MSGVLLFPSILAIDLNHFREQIQDAEQAGVDGFHVDVMDGHFVPNLSYGPHVAEAVRAATALPMEIHLMVERPGQWIEPFRRAGANRLIAHVEAAAEPSRWIEATHTAGLEAGLAVSPTTPAEALLPHLGALDLALVMTVVPGRGGQAFLPDMLPKVHRLRRLLRRDGRDVLIEVDGGVDEATAQRCVAAGARVLVAGTAVFRPAGGLDVRAGVEAIRRGAARGCAAD